MLEHCGASLGEDEGITTKVLEHHDINARTATPTQKENARMEAQEWYDGLAFLMGADRVRFGLNRMISPKGSTGTPSREWMHTMCWQIGNRTRAT